MTIPTAAAVLKKAASQIGYREGRNNDNKYGEFYGANNTAWCAQFIYWCIRQAGAEKGQVIPKTAWCPDLLSFARKNGLIVRDPARGDRSGTPVPGDIMLVQRTKSQDRNYANGAKHVGIVEKYLGNGYVQTIEGNTSDTGSATGNGVYRLKRKLTDQIVIFRPKWAKAPTPPASGGGGGSKPSAPKTEWWHVDPAKVSSFLWAVKHGKRNNIKLKPGRNVQIERWVTDSRRTWGVTPSDNWLSKAHLKKGRR